jgi:hypothetical protein
LNDAVEKVEQYMGLVKVIPTGATNGTVGATGTVTVGNAVGSVTVSGAFSSLYDYYRIVYTDGIGSTTAGIRMTLGATATGYYWSTALSRYDNLGLLSGGGSNALFWDQIGFTSSTGNLLQVELSMPFLARRTGIIGWHWDTRTGGGTGFGFTGGHLNDTNSYTAFTITASSGTMTGGQIRIYGYRN